MPHSYRDDDAVVRFTTPLHRESTVLLREIVAVVGPGIDAAIYPAYLLLRTARFMFEIHPEEYPTVRETWAAWLKNPYAEDRGV